MEEQTLKVLDECSSGCKMAMDSIDQMQEYVKNERLSQVLDEAKEKHERLSKRTAKALASHGECKKKPGKAAEAFAWITTEMKMMMRDDSHQAAKIMMNGCNMGVQSLTEVLNECPEADRESREIAADIVKAEEDFAEKLKPFL